MEKKKKVVVKKISTSLFRSVAPAFIVGDDIDPTAVAVDSTVRQLYQNSYLLYTLYTCCCCVYTAVFYS